MPAALDHHLGSGTEDTPYGYFVRTGASSYRSTMHSSGAWQVGEQHMAVASGLVIHHLETALPGDKLISRIAFDILGVIHSGEFDVEVEVVRPGRTIELVEARMVHRAAHTGAAAVPATAERPARPATEGRPRTSVVARVWRLLGSDTGPVAGDEFDAPPGWAECAPRDMSETWPGGYIGSLDGAEAAGGRPGRRRVWSRSGVPLVAGEADATYARAVKLVDGMNGFAVREDPQQIFFPNVDLTIHFLRAPEAGEHGAVGFDIRQSFGPTGMGLTQAVLHDERGPLGTAAQSLTVRMPTGAGRADG